MQTRRCQRNRKFQNSDGCGSIVPNPGAAFRPRTGCRPADVIRDLSAACTAARFAQCRESRARRTHEFARSAGRASRTRPKRKERVNETPQAGQRLKFRLLVLSFVYFGERPSFRHDSDKPDAFASTQPFIGQDFGVTAPVQWAVFRG